MGGRGGREGSDSANNSPWESGSDRQEAKDHHSGALGLAGLAVMLQSSFWMESEATGGPHRTSPDFEAV